MDLGRRRLWSHMPRMGDHLSVFDRRAVRLHRDRAAGTVQGVADLLREGAERLLDRLNDTTRRFSYALDVGGRGIVAPLLRGRGITTVACDLSARMVALSGPPCLAADEEFLPFAPASFDLIVASLSLHWVNDLPGALIQLRRVLRPDGLLLASIPVRGTLGELREALAAAEVEVSGGIAPRISPFPELRDCAALLQRAGYALPVADLEELQLLYADRASLLRDLRSAGEANALIARDRRIPPRSLLPLALGRLATEPGGRVRASLKLAMLTGWAPGPGQPRPLARGSAQVKLADALADPDAPKSREIKADSSPFGRKFPWYFPRQPFLRPGVVAGTFLFQLRGLTDMPVRISRLAAMAAVLAMGSLTACEINAPQPAPVVVNPHPQTPPVVVQQPAPPPSVVVTPNQ